MMHLSKDRRTIFICYRFFKQLRARYGSRKPIHTDGAHWYNDDACKWLRLNHHVYSTELKNVMERFIQKIKDTTECFEDYFHCSRKEKCDKQHINNWLKMFVLYLHMGMNRNTIYEIFIDQRWLS
jgi:putative transposase